MPVESTEAFHDACEENNDVEEELTNTEPESRDDRSSEAAEPAVDSFHSDDESRSSRGDDGAAEAPESTSVEEALPPPLDPSSPEYQERLKDAEASKQAGNALYKAGQYDEALAAYETASQLAPPGAKERAVYAANSGACHMSLERFAECARCCSDALAIDPAYQKALNRRMLAHEAVDNLDSALADAKQILETDPTNASIRQKVNRWEPIVKERQEKMKEEVFGKLKDLGNNLLGRFGMSVDNFKMVQDPNTGGYSVNFQR